MKILNYLSAINLFVVLLMSFKNVHDTSLINTKKYAHNMLCNSRILGNTPSDNTPTRSNQTDSNTDSNAATNEGDANTSDQKNGESAENSQGTSENANQVETPAAPAKAETTQGEAVQPDNTSGTESKTAGERVTLLSDEEEEEEEEEEDDDEYEGDCAVNNGGCGENLVCEKMKNGAIKCSCPDGYKFNGSGCISLLSADSINYGFCGIIMIAITIISLLY
ncbi:merozoite surface protein 4/5, putative [Plasmodium vinckei brucechwatti]|uniref:Merozoite surface protein 4/5, putative n=1 Tax=Plasmodium vinckei brucechwatti TaxID=119398 RepID=A0A6V7RUD0_PLAVN|nr:merozoite surface protein 4/5, putative [Plasmodium vinckei brucechwatti]